MAENLADTQPEKELDADLVRILVENQKTFVGFLRKHLPSKEAAEDVLQASLLKAVRAGGTLANEQSVVAWFYRILRNALTDFYRSRAADGRRSDSLMHDIAATGNDYVPAADDEELQREICACFNRLLPTLKPEYAELVRRIDLQGESHASVMDTLGITSNNLMVRLHRSRQALRSSLEKSCGACTKHGCLDCTCGHDKNAHA